LDDLADVLLDVPLSDVRDVRHVHRLLLHILFDLIQERTASSGDRRRGDRPSVTSVLDWPRRSKDGGGNRRRQLINVAGKTVPPS
jgi:hypothetical protein